MAESLCDYLTVSHGALPGPIDYDMYFGLVMNEQRMAERYVYYMGLALTFSNSSGEVPISIPASVCYSKSQAESLHFEINAERSQPKER